MWRRGEGCLASFLNRDRLLVWEEHKINQKIRYTEDMIITSKTLASWNCFPLPLPSEKQTLDLNTTWKQPTLHSVQSRKHAYLLLSGIVITFKRDVKICTKQYRERYEHFKLIAMYTYTQGSSVCQEANGLLTSLNSLSSLFSYCAGPFGSCSCSAWQVLSWSKCSQKGLLLLRLCYHSAKMEKEP